MPQREPILRPLALAAVLAVGFAVVLGMLVGWANTIWEASYDSGRAYESVTFREDGEPLIHRYQYNGRFVDQSYRTLDDVETPAPNQTADGCSLSFPRKGWTSFPLEASQRVEGFSDQRLHNPAPWYFLHDGQRDGHGYFVGFDSQSKLCLGYIGRDGFHPDRPPIEQWFAVDGLKMAAHRVAFCSPQGHGGNPGDPDDPDNGHFFAGNVYMIAGDQLLRVDLRERSVTTVLDSTELTSLGMVTPVRPAKEGRKSGSDSNRHLYLGVRTPERVLLLDSAGKLHESYTIPADLRDQEINFLDLGNGTALLGTYHTLKDRSRRYGLTWIDAKGTVIRQREVALEGHGSANDRIDAEVLMAMVPVPLVGAVLSAIVFPLSEVDSGLATNYASALRWSLSATWPVLLAATVLGTALAFFCYRRQRRFAQPWTGVWMAFVFLLGIPGLLGYFFHRRWPPLDACPACGQSVPRDRNVCAACGVEFPTPQFQGIEVFA